jgi:hypothetical protein
MVQKQEFTFVLKTKAISGHIERIAADGFGS